MADDRFERTARMIGAEAVEALSRKNVIIFGIGGVGSYVAEALVRAGIGHLTFVDRDIVDRTNINRQLIALESTVGQPKAEVMRQRAREINPGAEITALECFYNLDNEDIVDLADYDYAVDAVDTVASKVLIIEKALAAGTPVISAMGAGNKLDPSRLRLADLAETSVCPLARVMRKRLKQKGIEHVQVVYSDELPSLPLDGARAPGSISFVPSAAGLLIAGAVVRALLGIDKPQRRH